MPEPPESLRTALEASGRSLLGPAAGGAWAVRPGAPGDLGGTNGPEGSGERAGPTAVARIVAQVSAEAVDRTRALVHPHLARVLDVLALGGAGWAVLSAGVEGVPVGRLIGAGPLTEAEAATLAIPMSQALGALHAAGLVHGTFRFDAVVVRPDGVPVLADLSPVLTPRSDDDRGPRGDLRDLIDGVLELLAPPAAYEAAGLGSATLRAALLELRSADELTADELVRTCFATIEPAPLRQPPCGPRQLPGSVRGADPGWLEGPGRLVEPSHGAQPGEPVGTGRLVEPGRPDAARAAAAMVRASAARGRDRGVRGGARLRAPGPVGRHRLRAARRARGAWSVGAVAVVLAAAVVLGRDVAVLPPTGAGPGAATTAVTAQADPALAAAQLSRLRAALLAQAESADLSQVEVVTGPAYRADAQILDALAGVQLQGLTAEVSDATTVAVGADGTARVRLTAADSGYVRIEADGRRRSVDPSSPRSVELELRWTPAGWRVWSVSPASTP
jgi:hypothetical protein